MEENLDDEAMPESEQSVAKEDVKLTFNERLLTHIVEGCKGVAYSFRSVFLYTFYLFYFLCQSGFLAAYRTVLIYL